MAIVGLTGIGFCIAFVMEEVLERSVARGLPREIAENEAPSAEASLVTADGNATGAAEEGHAFGRLLSGESVMAALAGLEMPELEARFVELMARDLEDGQALARAGNALREIARRSPDAAVELLYAMTPAEREKLALSVAQGWVGFEPASAFDWIESAWIDAEGNFIDRAMQNQLYVAATKTLLEISGDFGLATEVVERVQDPDLKRQLVGVVARQVVQDGPEKALERLSANGSGLFDQAIMDAVAEEWAARDGRGAMAWTLLNEEEVSTAGVRSIAKHLALGAEGEALTQFHQGLGATARRDSVAAEAARLAARRDPVVSADWALAIREPSAKREAVFDALYEIGYESFQQSVDYVNYVYAPQEVDRVPVLFATLKDWVAVDRPAVVDYLVSDRARLPDAVAEELLLMQ